MIKSQSKKNNFPLYLMIYTLLLAALGYLVSKGLPDGMITPAIIWIYLFFFLVTLAIHELLKWIARKGINSFVNYFMLLTVGKLLFFLTIVLLYALLNRKDAIPFIIAFFTLYLFFTGFEIVMSLRKKENIRKANPPTPGQNG
ncbi:MAG: hypothetical protein JXA03_16410 [Bacteroidales bacterium]|nr:hypothetical protein [Bacteroidales bacterium]